MHFVNETACNHAKCTRLLELYADDDTSHLFAEKILWNYIAEKMAFLSREKV